MADTSAVEQARDVMVKALMKERQCRRPCHVDRECDCITDTNKQIAALAASGLEIVQKRQGETYAGRTAREFKEGQQ